MHAKWLRHRKIAYWAPFIMLILGVVLYSYLLPARYNKVISLLDWLFSGTDTIIATLRSADIVLGQLYRIVLTKCIVWLWTIGFLISLYMCGYAWQYREDAYKERDDYLGDSWQGDFQDVLIQARMIKSKYGDEKSRQLYRAVRNLGEQLESISDFGRGHEEVYLLEQEICDKVRLLRADILLCQTATAWADRQDELIVLCRQIQHDIIKRNNLQTIS